MKDKNQYFWIGLLISLLVAICLFCFANQYGLGFTSDSDYYVEIAKQISESGISAEGFNNKPPFYPLLIHLVGVSGIWWTNLLFLIISISILYTLGSEIKTDKLRFGFRFLMATSLQLYWVHSFAWTEPLFIAVLLLAIYCLHWYEKTGWKSLPTILLAILLLLTLPFIRYAGIFILFPLFIYLLLSLPKKEKIVLIGFILFGILVIAFWVWKFQEGFGVRWENTILRIYVSKSNFIPHNLRSFSEGFSLWFLPLSIPKSVRYFCTALIISLLCFRTLQVYRTKQKNILTFCVIIFLVYYFIMHWVFAVTYFEAERYLAPLYGLLFLSLFLWMDEEWKNMKRIPKIILSTALIILLSYNALRTGKNMKFWNENRKEKSTSDLNNKTAFF